MTSYYDETTSTWTDTVDDYGFHRDITPDVIKYIEAIKDMELQTVDDQAVIEQKMMRNLCVYRCRVIHGMKHDQDTKDWINMQNEYIYNQPDKLEEMNKFGTELFKQISAFELLNRGVTM